MIGRVSLAWGRTASSMNTNILAADGCSSALGRYSAVEISKVHCLLTLYARRLYTTSCSSNFAPSLPQELSSQSRLRGSGTNHDLEIASSHLRIPRPSAWNHKTRITQFRLWPRQRFELPDQLMHPYLKDEVTTQMSSRGT